MHRTTASILCVWIGWGLLVASLFLPILENERPRGMLGQHLDGSHLLTLTLMGLLNRVLWSFPLALTWLVLFFSPLLCSHHPRPRRRTHGSLWGWTAICLIGPLASIAMLLFEFDSIFPGFGVFLLGWLLSIGGLLLDDPNFLPSGNPHTRIGTRMEHSQSSRPA